MSSSFWSGAVCLGAVLAILVSSRELVVLDGGDRRRGRLGLLGGVHENLLFCVRLTYHQTALLVARAVCVEEGEGRREEGGGRREEERCIYSQKT